MRKLFANVYAWYFYIVHLHTRVTVVLIMGNDAMQSKLLDQMSLHLYVYWCMMKSSGNFKKDSESLPFIVCCFQPDQTRESQFKTKTVLKSQDAP